MGLSKPAIHKKIDDDCGMMRSDARNIHDSARDHL